jgi:hypothetical protein
VDALETELTKERSESAMLKAEDDEYLTYRLDHLKNETSFDIKDNYEMIKGLKIRVATLETELTNEKSEHVKLKEMNATLNHRLEQNCIDANDNCEMLEGLTNRVATLETENKSAKRLGFALIENLILISLKINH